MMVADIHSVKHVLENNRDRTEQEHGRQKRKECERKEKIKQRFRILHCLHFHKHRKGMAHGKNKHAAKPGFAPHFPVILRGDG